MTLKEFVDIPGGDGGPVLEGACHDCGRGVRVFSEKTGGTVSIRGGALYEVPGGTFFKCEDCFSRGKKLKNYRECEVYSRIVGYLRPTSQWNSGKAAEYGKRTMLRF